MTSDYYQKNNEKLQKKACEKYQNLPEEEKSANMLVSDVEIFLNKKKEKKRQYGRERYKSLLEGKYRKKISRIQEIKTIWV